MFYFLIGHLEHARYLFPSDRHTQSREPTDPTIEERVKLKLCTSYEEPPGLLLIKAAINSVPFRPRKSIRLFQAP